MLSAEAKAAGYQLAAFDTLNGSTNTEAMQLGRQGELCPLWIVTDHQLGGRGRHNRAWIAPKGNLAASLVMETDASVSITATLGFVAGVALERAIVKVAPYLQNRLSLKWPNDILADGAKLSGILLESEAIDSKRRLVVVGIGVNNIAAPAGLPYPALSLLSLGANISAQKLFLALADEWSQCIDLWDRGHGFENIRTLWLERATGLGSLIQLKMPDGVLSGVFETIDNMGRLVLRRSDGISVVISTGDVYFGGITTARKD